MIILASVLQVDFHSQEMLDLLKNIPDITWTPGVPAIFAGKSEEEVSMMLGYSDRHHQQVLEPEIPEKEATMETQEVLEKAVFPDSFNYFYLRPECMLVRYMGTCFAPWAFASVGVFGDNRCIKGRDPVRVHYSEQYRISCDIWAIDNGRDHCVAGPLSYNPYFMMSQGLPLDTCVSYKGSYNNSKQYLCPNTCDDGSPLVRTKIGIAKIYDGFLYKPKDLSKEDMMKQHIMNFGCLLGSFDVYYDFLFYMGGLYQHVSGGYQHTQAINIIGWGEENGVKYWNVRNNWGETWGESGDHDPENYEQLGYFRILRGVNHCNIEERCTVYEV
ncbi:Cathepsin_B [Hexamita inflata]|uniref:Cathepsin B n=1 Tax=Hexamita inflata TaxID=28002 RepID=A0AA86RAG3_9EUKA|nr:Cathepsin B [Hexamita inflata]